jgi:predicted glycosyltransferase
MKKLLVYSHDTYGLGNIRRMLAICQYLLEVIPDLSILLVTGSPVIHSLRLPLLLDYIKLPCLTRTGRGEYRTKYLSASLEDAIRLRSDLILATVANFKPDLLMVDKKPFGVKGELAAALEYLESHQPQTKPSQTKLAQTKLVLVLRDILDSPETIRSNWQRNGHYKAVERFYDSVLVLGERKIFDPVREYGFPPLVAGKTEFCGYLGKEPERQIRTETRTQLNVGDEQKLVLVTSGGGEDGYNLLETYLTACQATPIEQLKSLMICGPEMPEEQRRRLQQQAAADERIIFREFAGEMMSLMAAADVIVSMGGYNTICEILSLQKSAIVVPRAYPTEEQWIRADRMSRLGFFNTIHPDELTPERLRRDLMEILKQGEQSFPDINLNALPVVAARVESLLSGRQN